LLQIFEIVLITFLPDTVKVEDTMKPSYSWTTVPNLDPIHVVGITTSNLLEM
jgi:hypothetical protein